MPGDRIIVRRVEAAVVDRRADPLVRVADQPPVPGETGNDREIALGGAEGHVRACRIAPLGDDQAVPQQKTVRPAAGPHRPQGFVPRRPLLEIPAYL